MTRRGSTLILVLWTLAITTVMVVSLQMTTYRAAAAGREALGTVRARWAARAGVEGVIAYLTWDAQQGDAAGDLRQFNMDMEALSTGTLASSAFLIEHWDGEKNVPGPEDCHARLNVNLADAAMLERIKYLRTDMANAILDWADGGDDERADGVEVSYYSQLPGGYAPRNEVVRNLQELEAVKGVTAELLRAEDWNLNGVLDPNEDDGELSWPPDNSDGILDAGWSAYLTATSRAAQRGPSGQEKVDLQNAEISEIRDRLGVDQAQAEALQAWAKKEDSRMVDLLTQTLQQIAQGQGESDPQSGQTTFIIRTVPIIGQNFGGNGGGGDDRNRRQNQQQNEQRAQQDGGGRPGDGRGNGQGQGGGQDEDQDDGSGQSGTVRNLTGTQLRAVLAEATIGPVPPLAPGLVNVNTASREVLELLPGMEPEMLDEIEAYRESNPEGMESILDLQRVIEVNRDVLAGMAPYIDTQSQVYRLTCRGRALPAMTQVELVVTIDRSRLPVTVIDYTER